MASRHVFCRGDGWVRTHGQKVATLVSKKQPAGFYKVEWDATGFASGIYLYKLETGQDYSKTKKLIVLK